MTAPLTIAPLALFASSLSEQAALTVRKADLEERLRLSIAALELAQLQRESQALLRLLVHDIKNPLSAILANAHYLSTGEGLADADARGALDDIAAGARRCEALIDAALATSFQTLAESPLSVSTFDVGTLLKELSHEYRNRAVARGQRISCAPVTLPICSDGVLLRRMVENLLVNALAYGPRDSVIHLSARTDGAEGMMISVTDCGPGVPRSSRALIFEASVRAENCAGIAGHGLGLSLVKRGARQLGGDVEVADNVGGGTVFTIRIARSKSAPTEGANLQATELLLTTSKI